MSSKHDRVAQRIAQKDGVVYNRGQGPDINSKKRAIEVETAQSVKDGVRQLQGFRKPVYIAGADREATKSAEQAVQGTTIGVMNTAGRIVKRSRRKSR